MFFLLKMILFLFIAAVFFILLSGYSFIKHLLRNIRQSQEQRDRRNGTSQSGHRTTVGGNVIIDRRDPKETTRKIIPDDEGEYVDYEENK